MNKSEFLAALCERLHGLPSEDIGRSLDYYGEMIDDRVEDGMTEEEAVAAIGSVSEIANQIMMEVPLSRLVKAKVKPDRTLKAWEIVLLILGSPVWVPLLLALIVVILAAYVVLWSFIVTLYAADFSFAAGTVAGIVSALAYAISGRVAQGVLFFGEGLIFAGLTILMFFGCGQIAKAVLRLSKMMLYGIKSCFVRKGETK